MDILTTTVMPVIESTDSTLVTILGVGFVIAFFLAFGVGANDVANSFGTSVGAKVLTLKQACILATIFEILGAILIGYKVSDTVRKGIFDVAIYEGDEKTLMLGCLAALLASAVWNILATFWAMPISGTHSIVGAMAGFSIVARGFGSINGFGLLKIIASWFVSPVTSGLLSAMIFVGIQRLILETETPIRNGLLSLPFFYFGTLFINLFSVLLDGPQVLKFDLIPAWGAFLISTLFSLAVAVAVWFFVVPRFRDQITERASKKTVDSEAANNAINEKHKNHNQFEMCRQKETHINVAFENTETDLPTKTEVKQIKSNAEDNETAEVNQLFSFLQVLTAIFGSFAHGGNDVSNAIGPLVSLYLIFTEQSVQQRSETPLWLLFYGGIGICVGCWVYGQKVMRTVGEDLTKILPATGFSIEVGAATTVLAASKIGLPISTTHCKVGSIVFVGFFNREAQGGGVNWNLFKGIVMAWLLTVPITGILSGLFMLFFGLIV